jgi:hypothetical protein
MRLLQLGRGWGYGKMNSGSSRFGHECGATFRDGKRCPI